MDKETVRIAFNKFLKMYFNSCREVYEELDYAELLTGRQFAYLRMLDKHDSVTMGQLANHFELSKPTVTEMIHKFETAGLVEKNRCETDGRVFHISLTEQGKLLANTNMLESKRAVDKMFAKLSEEDLSVLTALFEKVGQV